MKNGHFVRTAVEWLEKTILACHVEQENAKSTQIQKTKLKLPDFLCAWKWTSVKKPINICQFHEKHGWQEGGGGGGGGGGIMHVFPLRYLRLCLTTKRIKFYKRMPSLMTFTHFKGHMEFERIMF